LLWLDHRSKRGPLPPQWRQVCSSTSRTSSKEAAGVAPDRLRIVGGDFFNDPLPMADAYILRK
jgi:hypothetical protein